MSDEDKTYVDPVTEHLFLRITRSAEAENALLRSIIDPYYDLTETDYARLTNYVERS